MTSATSSLFNYPCSRLPHPEAELQRHQRMQALVKTFTNACKNTLNMEAPIMALVRWHYAQLCLPLDKDPIWR